MKLQFYPGTDMNQAMAETVGIALIQALREALEEGGVHGLPFLSLYLFAVYIQFNCIHS